MGTCVPSEILGSGGYLSRRQNSIKQICIIIGGPCADELVDLSAFKSLSEISWVGVRSYEDYQPLAESVQANSAHLTRLRLDFSNVTEYDRHGARTCFPLDVLQIEEGKNESKLPALQHLSLSCVDFEEYHSEIGHALNFAQLSSLTLRHCPATDKFLKSAILAGHPIRLRYLEIQTTNKDLDTMVHRTMIEFLQAFQGLEKLHVAVAGPVNETLSFLQSLAHHKATLSEFVYHQRMFDDDETSMYFEKRLDLLDLSALFHESMKWQGVNDPVNHPFLNLELRYIAVCAYPCLLVCSSLVCMENACI